MVVWSLKHFAGNCKKVAVCGITGSVTASAWAFEWETNDHQQKAVVNDSKVETHMSNSASCAVSTAGGHEALPIVTVKVKGKGQVEYITTNALLDTEQDSNVLFTGIVLVL